MAQWFVNGVDLERFGVQRTSVVRPPVQVRVTATPVPGAHGVRMPSRPPVFDEPMIGLDFMLKGPDTDALAAELMGLFASSRLDLARVVDGHETVARGRLLSITPGDHMAGVYGHYTVVLGVPGVFFRGEPGTVGLNRGDNFLGGLADSTAPINDPVFRVQGHGRFAVTDSDNGTSLSWDGAAPDGGFVFVSAELMRAWASMDANGWDGPPGPQAGVIDYPPAGRLHLWPHPAPGLPGGRALNIYLDADATILSVVMRARPAYL